MGGNSSITKEDIKDGDVVSTKLKNSFLRIAGRHHGVVVENCKFIISKYPEGLKKVPVSEWTDLVIEKRAGPGCAAHAIARYNDAGGKVGTQFAKEEYALLSKNCQHFAEDCHWQKDGYGGSSSVSGGAIIAGVLGVVLLGAGTAYAVKKVRENKKKNTVENCDDSPLD